MSAPLNIPATELSAETIYEQGRVVEQKEHADLEATKLGTLRGGNSGCLTEGGEVYGTCHRKALARYKGHNAPIDAESGSFYWFDAGYANEEAWAKKLDKAMAVMGPEYILKSEEECPIVWEAAGVPVTGRPDFMIFKGADPVLGFELKSCNAVKSACSVYLENKPKTDNLVQAAHYSMVSGCPFILVYSYRGKSRVPGWYEQAKYQDRLEVSEKTFTNGKTGKSFTKKECFLRPFTKEFRLGFDDDKLYYLTDTGVRVDTPITASGIKKYYELIVGMDQNKDLYTRVTTRDLNGKQLFYDPCAYCPLQAACDAYETNYDAWMDKVSLICGSHK